MRVTSYQGTEEQKYHLFVVPRSHFHCLLTWAWHARYITWAGVFAYTRASQGVGLEGYVGGSEGGPIVLFEPGISDRPAAAMSPYEEFMSTIMALRHLDENPVADAQCSTGAGFEPNVDFDQHDFPGGSTKNISTAADCCALCAQDTACRAWSWIGPNSTIAPNLALTCYRKRSDAGRTSAGRTGHVSGRIANKQLVLVAGVQGQVCEAFQSLGSTTAS